MTQLAKQNKEWLVGENLKEQISQALPKGIEADRFMRCLFTQVQKVPKLMSCKRESLFSAIITCGQLGIEPDGRRAHMIPYGDNCTLILDYKGLVELVLRNPDIVGIHADIVREGDDFVYDKGVVVKHESGWGNSGKILGAYAMVTFRNGFQKAERMSFDEIEAIRNKSQGKNSSPWKEHWGEMAKKTVFRRLCKWLPLSTEVKIGLDKDDEQYQAPKAPSIFEEVETVESTVIEAEEV